ncbi:TPA: hypothetical protein TVS37_001860 [Streptococcus equi subsp. zooepidemicus]|nr:hypothetical protein [Streptococcus equi subsp. zooepidemicus]
MIVKKKVIILLGIVAILVMGGIFMFSYNQNQEQILERQFNHEQKRIVLYLLNHYSGINEIEFNDIENNSTTGSKNVLLTINNKIKMEVTFFNLNDDTDNYVISWNGELSLIDKNPITHLSSIDKIKVKYWSNNDSNR